MAEPIGDVDVQAEAMVEQLRDAVVEYDNQYRLAQLTGVSQPTINRFIRGADLGFSNAAKLMVVFQAKVKYGRPVVPGGHGR